MDAGPDLLPGTAWREGVGALRWGARCSHPWHGPTSQQQDSVSTQDRRIASRGNLGLTLGSRAG